MWFRCGVIEKDSGNIAAARAAFGRALAINPRFDRHEEARAALRDLKRPTRPDVNAIDVRLRVAK
jgi:hypothetical protein